MSPPPHIPTPILAPAIGPSQDQDVTPSTNTHCIDKKDGPIMNLSYPSPHTTSSHEDTDTSQAVHNKGLGNKEIPSRASTADLSTNDSSTVIDTPAVDPSHSTRSEITTDNAPSINLTQEEVKKGINANDKQDDTYSYRDALKVSPAI